MRKQLVIAEKLMFVQPDSALQIMRTIDRSRITREEVLARYALRYAQALDRNQILSVDDSLARIAADYYVDRGTPEERTAAFYYLGCIYSNAGRQQDAAKAIVKAEVFSRDLGDKNPYLRGLVYHAMGLRYYLMKGGRDEAIYYYQQALDAFTQTGNYFNIGCAHQSLSRVYYNQGLGSEALENLRKAIECFEKSSIPTEWMLARLRHGEKVYCLMFDSTYTDKARKDSVLRYISSPDPSMISPDEYQMLALFYIKDNQLDSARWSAKQILQAAKGDGIWRSRGYVSLAKIAEIEGNFREALDFYCKSVALADSVERVRHFSMAASLRQRLEAEALQHEYTALRAHHRYLYIVAALTFLVILLLGWQLVQVTRRWRRRLQAYQQAQAQRLDETAKRLSAAYDELKSQYESLLDKRHELVDDEREAHFHEALELRLNGLKRLMENAYLYKSRPTAFFRAFASFATVNPNSKKEVWADLQYVVNKKYGGVVDYLRTNYPALSSRDLDLCCLLCFGFSPAGICFIYGYDEMGTLYNKRSRLRQRLGLVDQKLEDFLSELCMTLTKQNGTQNEKSDPDDSISVAG